jgi:hypothetical protein
MTSLSTTLRLNKEFAIAVTPENGRSHAATNAPAQAGKHAGYVVADRSLNAGVSHDAFFDVSPTGLELRFDQDHKRGGGGQQPSDLRQDELKRNKAHVYCGELRRNGHPARIEIADVGFLD